MGLEEGIHQLGQLEIEIRKGSAYIAGTDTLCGSIAEMSKCIRHFKEATGKNHILININYIVNMVLWLLLLELALSLHNCIATVQSELGNIIA